ncbi:serine hydrolase [Sphingomonas mesophila]|uniref:serine hydrolase n=1 Tax=Sphingomonas mesophila TaxID=2303576 RepID=UPI0013C336D4|nr:serine hydrolase [Sphingomonas mesophila]
MPSILLAAALSLAAQSAAPDPVQSVDRIFAETVQPGEPGCVAGVAKDGRTIVEQAYGMAELEHKVPLTTASILEAGSIAKQFTAAAILLLVEDGKLALGDDVRRHVPELRDYGATITIDQLLNHSSGLRDWGMVAEIAGWPRGARANTHADALAIVLRQRALNHAPGAEYSYSNSGYTLLTEIVRRVSGRSLADFTRERLFVPLGMTSTSWRDEYRRVVPGRATAYAKDGPRFIEDMPFEDAYGNGGLLTTVGDLLRWNAALSQRRLGKRVAELLEQRSVLFDGTTITYARGLVAERHGGVPVINHSGATGGYRAWLGRFPDQRLSVALLCNRADANSTRLAKQMADLFLPAVSEAAPYPPAATRVAAGLFASSRTGRTLRMSAEEGQPRIAAVGALTQIGPDRYRTAGGEVLELAPHRIRLRDAQGQSVDHRRVAQVAPSLAQLAAYTGRFTSAEADATYIVSPDRAGLRLQLDGRPQVVAVLAPTYADTFENESTIVRFKRDSSGRVTALTIGVARVRELIFRKIR